MAWIPFYADGDDFVSIIERLNGDSEIAFIQPYGKGKWIAKERIERLTNGDHCLWHIPGGEIKRYSEGKRNVFSGVLQRLVDAPKKMTEESGLVATPWKGWKGPHESGKKDTPFLGSEPNIIRLKVSITGIYDNNAIGMSGFGWIANRYKAVGNPAHKTTVHWWNRLRHWIRNKSVSKITHFGPLDYPQPTIWAFSSAYKKIKSGKGRDPNSI